MGKKKQKNIRHVKYIALTGILLGLTLLFNYAFGFLKVLNGYSIEVWLLIVIFSLILIDVKYYAWTYLFICPILMLITGFSVLNFWDLLMEYIIPIWLFFPFIYFLDLVKLFNKKKKTLWYFLFYSLFILLTFLCFTIKLIFSVVAGFLWWTPGNLLGSFILNAGIIWGSFGIIIPVGILLLLPIYKLSSDLSLH